MVLPLGHPNHDLALLCFSSFFSAMIFFLTIEKPDAKKEYLPPSTPIVDRSESKAIGPKNIFPIFKMQKANVNFSSRDIKVFKANSTRANANAHLNVAATAKKIKKKNVNIKKGNSILNYLQVKPVWGRAEAGQQHPPT